MKLRWAMVGVVAMTVGCQQMHMGKDREEDEKDEVKLTLDQVPPAVKATLQQQAGGAAITSVDKEQKHGKTIYETDVQSGGKNWEIQVAEDGTLVSKKVEDEDEKDEQEKR